MRICLFEDRDALSLAPISLTRPVFDLLCGTGTLARQQLRSCPAGKLTLLVRPELAEDAGLNYPHAHINDVESFRDETTVFINGRWLPPLPGRPIVTDRPCVGLNGTEIAFVVAPPEFVPDNPAEHLDECLDTWKKTLPMFAAGGSIVHTGWDLVCQNAARLCAQFESRSSDDDDTAGWRPAGCGLVGPADRLLIDPLAQIDPQVVFDTTRGPVTIEAGAVVTAFSRIQGPCHIGSGTHVKSARIGGGTTLGPSCHVSGHVECSILQGLSNKFHEGFLGHSYVGSWVNIGAGVQVSDLRIAPSESVPPETAHTRTGALIGDYSNLAIGSLIDAGTVIGVFAETIPTGQLLPSLVPSFCTTSGDRLVERSDLDSLLASAATLMARRGRALSPAHIALIRTLFAATAPDRRHALRDVERRRLRKTA